MKWLLPVRAAVGVLGFIVWAYGARYDESHARLAGIAMLAIAVVLRFLRPRDSARRD